MALAFSNLAEGGSGTNAASYATASISPEAGSVLLVAVETDTVSATPGIPVLSGLSATWTQILDCYFDQTGTTYRLTTFMGVRAVGTGTITIDYAGVAQGGCAWVVDQVIMADPSNLVVQSAKVEPGSASTNITATLPGAISSGNGAWMCASWEAAEVASSEAGWTDLGDGNHSGPAGAVATMARADNADNSGTITWTTSAPRGAVILEIRALEPITVGSPTPADTPRSDFLGAAYTETTGALVAMNTAITFHNGDPMTQHSGEAWQFHDPVVPDRMLVEGSNKASSVPRSDFAGEADK